MANMCLYCQTDTAGQHQPGCPNRSNGNWTFDYQYNIKKFNWEELNGKELKIRVGKDVSSGDYKGLVVIGEDKDGMFYVLHNEPKKLTR